MKNIQVKAWVVFYISLLTTFSCTPKAAFTSEITIQQKPEVPSLERWQQEWERWLAEAKKEGKVSIRSSVGGQLQTDIRDTFYKRFGINVEHLAMRGEEFTQKLKAERMAGLYTTDVYFGGTSTIVNSLKPAGFLDHLEPFLILPEVIDPGAWYKGGLDWLDPEHLIVAFFAYPSPPIIVNTDLVKSGEIKSYQDLLTPKWKGKIVIDDPTISGSGSKLMGVIGSQIMGWDFVAGLAKQDLIITRDKRLHVDWIARGKYPVAMSVDKGPVTEFQKAGAPIAYVNPIEGSYVSSGIGDLVFINKAPHPNAAKIFMNWLLTREGQITISKASGYQSGRADIPTDFLDPALLRNPQQKYIYAYDEAYARKEPELMVRNRDIFGHLIK